MIRIALLGADSSHADKFLGLLNGGADPALAARAAIATVWDADPAQAEAKAGAVPGARPAASPAAALEGCDLAMVCARWGEDHHALAAAALAAGLAVFVDKPLTADPGEARDLAARGTEAGVPLMSCSSYRYSPDLLALRDRLPALGDFRAAVCLGLSNWPAFGPRGARIHFYGIHVVEILLTLFGAGIAAVRTWDSGTADLAQVRYADGRTVDVQFLRDCARVYEAHVFGAEGRDGTAVGAAGAPFAEMLDAVVTMAETGRAPLPLADAVTAVDLLDAVERGRSHGRWIDLPPVAA